MSSAVSSSGSDGAPGTDQRRSGRRAGAFDIRTFIATLLGLYGVVLVVTGLVGTSDAELRRADGLNINLWAGVGLLVVSLALVTWARLRPVVVPPEAGAEDETPEESEAEGSRVARR